jgi:hypothetical protein
MTIRVASLLVIVAVAGCSREYAPLRQYEGPPITGQLAVTDLDTITLTVARSFHDQRIVSLERVRGRKVVIVMSEVTDGSDAKPKRVVREVPEGSILTVFSEFEEQLMRADLFERSLRGSDISTDGSVWSISGKKGDLIVTHERVNAPDEDPAMYGLGMRLLRLGGIEIPGKEIY